MSRKLSLNEVKQHQLKMLECFDEFCKKNDIPYFLAYGTLLGAIRHKGYIPWDDDVDVMVPRPWINTIIEKFNHPRYKIISVDKDPTYIQPYPRLVDTNTFYKRGLNAKFCGINIDIYPIDAYPNNKEEEIVYRNYIKKINKRKLFIIKWFFRILKIFPIPNFPIVKHLVKKHEEALASFDYYLGNQVHVFDLDTEPIDKSLFDEMTEVEFEGRKFFAPKNWDTILRIWYGDYMQLPPEDKRHPYHSTNNLYIIEE